MLEIKGQKRNPLAPSISISALFNLSSFRHWQSVVANQKEINFTRADLKRDRKILAKAFLELGVKSGDIITVKTGRSMYQNVVIFLAANKIGAIVAFLDEKTTHDSLIHYLDEFESSLLITFRKTAKGIKKLKKDAKTVKNVINLDANFDEKNFEETILETFMLGKTPITKVAQKYTGHVPKNIFAAKKEALISFTSGSTSGPKPMVFTNKSLIASAIYSKVASNVKMWDKELHTWMSYVKMDCPYGLVVSVLAPILGGGEVIFTPDIDDNNLNYYIGKNANTIFGIPHLLEILPNKLDKSTDISDLKMFASGGERLEKSASLAAIEFFKSRGLKNVKISNGYGVGEALGLISTAVGTAAYNPDSVGRIPAGVHVMVLNAETGEELDFGKTGILYVNGKHILSRYFNRPELDEKKIMTIHGRKFVKTGDLAYVSEDGYITLVGRATFFINNLPAKVYYEVVRAAVAKSDLVKKCYVVKGPDEKLELAPYAFVVLNDEVPKNNHTRREIAKTAAKTFYLGKRRITLKPYEIPRKIIFLDDLPLTRADKVDFRKLEQMAKEA